MNRCEYNGVNRRRCGVLLWDGMLQTGDAKGRLCMRDERVALGTL